MNGLWKIAGGKKSIPPESFTSTIPVPAVVDMAKPPYDWEKFEYHWYRTSFSIKQLPPSQNIFLKIEQSMFGTDVWLNGHHLGGSISCYTSHEYALDAFFLRDDENEILVRVGAKSTLPPESAVGRDQEKEIYTPGIWGDVRLECAGGARVTLVQVIPHIDTANAEVRVWIQNLRDGRRDYSVSSRILEKKSDKPVSSVHQTSLQINKDESGYTVFHLSIESLFLWSHEDPFLYEAEVTLHDQNEIVDRYRATFGMREFRVVGSDFYLNGKKILLRGGNIAFHRFLSDPQRKMLPWNELWIKKAFIDIPKEHYFNFFRNHLGHMYNKWYDIADEYGMLIQNEWQFWCPTGSDDQIRKEFTQWLHDNWNHPSIIIWDPLNESSDDTIQHEIVPEMKKLDPTRPWESVDFLEEHPYIYSLGMVLNDRKFGFTRSLHEIENLPVPSMVNEFLWWWFNHDWKPTILTAMIVERWMGRAYSRDAIIAHQSFLAQELIELFRRMRIKAIQPFVYISNNDGPTAHWFLDDIADLQPKPLLRSIKNAFAPFGVSIEIWDRHFFVNERRTIRCFVFNDSSVLRRGTITIGVKSNAQWISQKKIPIEVRETDDVVITEEIIFPDGSGTYFLCAELTENTAIIATSTKIVHVFHAPSKPAIRRPICIFDPSDEIPGFCREKRIPYSNFDDGDFQESEMVLLHGNVLGSIQYKERREVLSRVIKEGRRLVLVEPEYRVVGTEKHTVVEGVDLTMTHRSDSDKGGYDSYVFMEGASALWKGISQEHLKMFNGAYGGEMVSQFDVEFSVPSTRLASCGMGLAVTAASEVEYGKGKIVLIRIQVRGRLTRTSQPGTLYSRRIDPVAQLLLLNIFAYNE